MSITKNSKFQICKLQESFDIYTISLKNGHTERNQGKISNCTPEDSDTILSLYQSARDLQTQKGMVVWPVFKKDLIENEIKEQRQWKLLIEDTIACNWAITFADKEIWGEKDKDDAIYIHRIATDPRFRGNRYVDRIVSWAKEYAKQKGKLFVRLDTLGNNTGLIRHYTSAGFQFLGMFEITDTSNLPGHYHVEPNCCLFEIALAHEYSPNTDSLY